MSLPSSKIPLVVLVIQKLILTHIEWGIMSYLMSNPGTALLREDIFNKVWQYEGSNADIVKRHVSNIRRKLGSQSKYIQTNRVVGGFMYAPP